MWNIIWYTVFILKIFSKEISGNDFIEKINSVQKLWKAVPNHLTKLDHDMKKMYLGTKFEDRKHVHQQFHTINNLYKMPRIKIPETFDARTKWTNCTSIGAIKDQGACSADWAVSTATIASDRLCIASKSKINVNISMEDLLSCDGWCDGCNGCQYESPWIHLMRYGVVTGGDYGSNEGCKPFSVKPCGTNCKNQNATTTPDCIGSCSNTAYNKSYNDDNYFGTKVYELRGKNIKSIQLEILTHGPVASLMEVYEDFYSYKEGIYAYVHGKYLGYHSVKILGWGKENGINYWLVANSWGKEYGEKGFFKIRRGINECFIEGKIVATRLKV